MESCKTVNICATSTLFNFYSLAQQNLNSKSQNLNPVPANSWREIGPEQTGSKISRISDSIRPDWISGRLLICSIFWLYLAISKHNDMNINHRLPVKCDVQYPSSSGTVYSSSSSWSGKWTGSGPSSRERSHSIMLAFLQLLFGTFLSSAKEHLVIWNYVLTMV